MTWTDKSTATSANGGNCLNLQVTKEEISSVRPHLYQFGKNRGVTDVQSAEQRPIVEYTWGKLYNPRQPTLHMPGLAMPASAMLR